MVRSMCSDRSRQNKRKNNSGSLMSARCSFRILFPVLPQVGSLVSTILENSLWRVTRWGISLERASVFPVPSIPSKTMKTLLDRIWTQQRLLGLINSIGGQKKKKRPRKDLNLRPIGIYDNCRNSRSLYLWPQTRNQFQNRILSELLGLM